MNHILLFSGFAEELHKVAEAQKSQTSDSSGAQQNQTGMDPNVKRDLMVGGAYGAASALGQGLKKHKKEKRSIERRQAFADSARAVFRKSERRAERLHRLREAADKVSRGAVKTEGKKQVPDYDRRMRATATSVRSSAALNRNRTAKATGLTAAHAVGSGIKGGVKTLIKQKLGIDSYKNKGTVGKALHDTGSVAGKTVSALSSKKTQGAFRTGMQHSQIIRAMTGK